MKCPSATVCLVGAVDELIRAARSLDLAPRTRRWRSVTSCVLDAVWSINTDYDSMVVPYVRQVFSVMDGGDPLTSTMAEPDADPTPLTAFRDRFPTTEELAAETSKHRTSPRSGILKAEAALRYADALLAHDIDTLHDAWKAIEQTERASQVTAALKGIPGDGVRTGYFWMLVGSTDHVKPDRHILAWLDRHGHATDVAGAKVILTDLARNVSTPELAVTPSDLDHAIWRSEARR